MTLLIGLAAGVAAGVYLQRVRPQWVDLVLRKAK